MPKMLDATQHLGNFPGAVRLGDVGDSTNKFARKIINYSFNPIELLILI